jgi:hypothetical protein
MEVLSWDLSRQEYTCNSRVRDVITPSWSRCVFRFLFAVICNPKCGKILSVLYKTQQGRNIMAILYYN